MNKEIEKMALVLRRALSDGGSYLEEATVLYDAGYRNVNEMKVISPKELQSETGLSFSPYAWSDIERCLQAQLNADKGDS